MTTEQMEIAKANARKVIKLYGKERKKMFDKQGFVMENQTYMLGWTRNALKTFFGTPVEVSWDEACQIFDSKI